MTNVVKRMEAINQRNNNSKVLMKNGSRLGLGLKSRWSGVVGGGGVLLAAIIFAGVWMVQRAPAGDGGNTPPTTEEMDVAMQQTLEATLANPGCPKDPEKIKQFVAAGFPILHPELATRQRRAADLAFALAQDQALSQILNPKAFEAELLKNPEFVRQRDEAMQALLQRAGH